MPISVAVTGDYQYNTFSDSDLTANTIAFGLTIAHQIKASGNLDIFPAGSVLWGRTTVNLSGFMEDFTDISYGLNTTLLFSKKFYITPHLVFSDGDSVFSLFIGILFPS